MQTGQEILKLLTAQRGHYLALRQAVDKQTGHIEAMDVGQLAAGTAEVRSRMRKIRDVEARLRPLRQSWSSRGVSRPPGESEPMEGLVSDIRSLIGEVQKIKDQNAAKLKSAMLGLRKQITGLKTQSRAAAAYRPRRSQPARFVDREE